MKQFLTKQQPWPRRLVGCYHNIMDKIRDVSEIDFKVEEVMKAKSFNDFVNGDVEKAFYLGFFRNLICNNLYLLLCKLEVMKA